LGDIASVQDVLEQCATTIERQKDLLDTQGTKWLHRKIGNDLWDLAFRLRFVVQQIERAVEEQQKLNEYRRR